MKTDSIVRLEYAALAATAAYFFIQQGFGWYWLVPMFFVYDIGMVGYAINSKVGAVIYNSTHSLFVPLVFIVLYAAWQPSSWLLFIALTQLFHIGIDRFLGYGLKYGAGFRHTHLGTIGSKKH